MDPPPGGGALSLHGARAEPLRVIEVCYSSFPCCNSRQGVTARAETVRGAARTSAEYQALIAERRVCETR